MCAVVVTRISGDLRKCFEILRSTLQEKIVKIKALEKSTSIEEVLTKIKVTPEEVHSVFQEMYQSKL